MIKIPYGISNFNTLVTRGQYYVDRTNYIEVLENYFSSYLVFVRPRRFGKSLFLSMLEYYYGIQHKPKFEQLFGQYYIGQQPTDLANTFLILKFDFSQMNTSSFEKTHDSFLENVRRGVSQFYGTYPQFFDEKLIEKLDRYTFPAHIMQDVLLHTEIKAPGHKIYLLVDEYDHFANEILSFRFQEFVKMVSENGFVRKFYEAIKVGTHSGVLDRLFITGVSPLTLDSLTSGFNISVNISLEETFNAMMGFKEEEVLDILKGIEAPTQDLPEMMVLMKRWYDGYKFSTAAKEQIYNSDMVLYFASHYSQKKEYPESLLDSNIASDYKKIRRLFTIKDKEKENLQYLEELLEKGQIKAVIVRLFEIEWRFGRKDFISLLYYTGILTIESSRFTSIIFRMPNYVIQVLYYQYFHQIILERSGLHSHLIDVEEKVLPLALDNNPQPIINYAQSILTELSNRDKMKFDERYVKIIFTSALYTVGIYTIHNEFEVKKSPTTRGYVDILLTKRAPFKTKYQFAIELKYLKKSDADQAETVKEAAIKQLKNYLQHDDYLKGMKAMKAYVILFVGNEGTFVEVFP